MSEITHENAESPAQEALEKAAAYLDLIKTRESEFERGWWKKGEKALEMYTLSKPSSEAEELPYNILYSNTEVLAPSLFSATPKANVRARFRGASLKPIPEFIERFLSAATDCTAPGTESFTDAGDTAVLSALTTGGGFMRIREDKTGPFPIIFEDVFYKNFLWGKGRKWSKVGWVSFKHEMSPKAFQAKFELEDDDMEDNYVGNDEDGAKADCCVYEFWHKATRTVCFLSEEWRDKLIGEPYPDPLKLAGFFPTPGVLALTKKPGSITPTPLFEYYRNQAEELNRVSVRLNKVLSAIRVRGVYSSLLGTDLKNLLADSSMENALLEASNAGMLAQGGGFDKNIWMLPIEKLIIVAQQLYQARESIKQVIYELTGISDIIRGSSVASETATAQDLKNKWGTVRLRKMQTIVALYMRDLFRLAIDAAVTVVPPEQWKSITQMPLLLAQEKAVAVQQQQYQMMQYQAMASQQPPPAPGQPPSQPPPPPPENPLLKQPTVEEVLQKITDDNGRTYSIDIETSSTVDIDTASDKAEVSEYMNALSQLLMGLQPLVMMGPTGTQAAKAILIAVTQRYKFGESIIDSLEALEPPEPPPPEPPKGPPPPSPEEQQALQAEAQTKIAASQAKMQQIQLDMQLAAAKNQLEIEKLNFARQELALNLEKSQLAIAEAKIRLQQKKAAANAPVSN